MSTSAQLAHAYILSVSHTHTHTHTHTISHMQTQICSLTENATLVHLKVKFINHVSPNTQILVRISLDGRDSAVKRLAPVLGAFSHSLLHCLL